MKTTQLTTEAAAALAGGHPMTTPLHKQPLAQACKEAKGPIEFHSAVVHTAKEINGLAALLEGDLNTRTIAAATYPGLSQLAAAALTAGADS